MDKRVLFSLAALGVGGTAAAQTPDEVTPAVEDVCSSYEGRLFGLCNDYCEAKDCDDPRVKAAEPACAATEKKFLRLTGLERMPCESPKPEECTVSAEYDYKPLVEHGPFTIPVLDNDTSVPAGLDLFVSTHTASDGIQLADAAAGIFSGTWSEEDDAFNATFEYTACCAPGRCDTATVTVVGS